MGKRRIKKPKPNKFIALIPSFWAYDEKAARKKGCTSKTTYYSEKEANQAALMARMGVLAPVVINVNPYKCRFCENWHIGHSY